MSDVQTDYYFEAEIYLTLEQIDEAGSIKQAIQDELGSSGVVVLEVQGEDF